MADDPERDLIPMKDVTEPQGSQCVAHTECSDTYGLDRPSVLEKKIAEQLSRNDLEDHLYMLRDENMELKKNSHKQEDHIKKLTTKMSRFICERKKFDVNSSPYRKRDLEMEEVMEELHDKVRNLEKNNVQLREKLLVAKQQVISQNRRPNAYNYVPPKVNSNRPRSAFPYTGPSNIRTGISISNPRGNTSVPAYAMQLLDEARVEISNLKEIVATQKNDIDFYEQEVELYKEKMRMKDIEFDEEMNVLRSQVTDGQRQHVHENLDLIRLHRELKQKNSKIVSLQAQLTEMEEKLRAQRTQQDRLLQEIDDKSVHLREEQKKSLDLFSELQKNKAALHNFMELQDSFKSLKKENDVLKDTNDKLIKSVLSQERERTSQSLDPTAKDRASQFESALHEERREKVMLQESIRQEQEKYLVLQEEHKKLQTMYSDVKSGSQELEMKINILKDQEVDFDELGEALALIKLKKQRSININFLEKVPSLEEEENLKSKLQKSEQNLAETSKELSNVRGMLMTQYKLNKEVQEELKSVADKFAQCEKEYQTKLQEYANLLDIRSAKIQKLERQLNDVAYGTKKIKIEEFQKYSDAVDVLELEKGENLFEIHIVKFVFSDDGVLALKNTEPCSFITWNFYEFELQSTPIVKGTSAHFNCSAQYRVRIDDFFLFYLHKNTTTLELHQSTGADYKTLAACQLNFSELLEQPHGRIHGTQHLISVQDSLTGVVFGTVHFWVKLHVPMEEAFKLYKQKFKALKYIQSNQIMSNTAAKILDQPIDKDSSVNDLHFKILRCKKLKGSSGTFQPSSFCIYKFYTFPDEDTIIVPSSNEPEFSHHKTFSICLEDELETYLKTQSLQIYVFDDNNPVLASYIGVASVPLLPLSNGKSVTGLFELTKENNKESCGTIELSIFWQQSYQSMSAPVSLPPTLDQEIEFPPHISPVLPVFTAGGDGVLKNLGLDDERISSANFKDRERKGFRTSTPCNVVSDSSSDSSPHLQVKKIEADAKRRRGSASSTVSGQNKSPYRVKTQHFNGASPSVKSPKVCISPDADDTNSESSSSSSSCKITPVKIKTPIKVHEEEDTVSEKRQEISFEEISDIEDKQVLTDSDSSTESDHEIKKNSSCSSNITITKSSTIPEIVIGIHRLKFKENASALQDPKVRMIYIEYKFLDYPIEDLETPNTLPKPIPPEYATFEYRKAFSFHPEKNVDKFRLLAQMFNPDCPEASWIKFTVVNEPPSDEGSFDCDDLGYACVDLRQIISQRKDLIEEDILIYDSKELEKEMGYLTITIEALRVLSFL